MSKKSKQILVVSLFIIVAMILIDQVSKFLVSSNMKMFENISVIKGFFSIYRCTNTGSAFSFLGGYSWSIIFLSIFSSIASIVVLYFVFLSFRKEKMLLSIAFSLIFAGAVGNLIDRIRLHHVVDFLRFDFGSYTFPIFNIADSCAVVGTILLLFCILFKMKDIDELLAQFKRSDANKRGIDSEN